MSTLESAPEIAAAAHSGQQDKAGQPYILHPIRVLLTVKTSDERIAAMLHDTVEDTAITFEDLVDADQNTPEKNGGRLKRMGTSAF